MPVFVFLFTRGSGDRSKGRNIIAGTGYIGFLGALSYVLWLFSVQLSTRLMDDVDSKMKEWAKGRTHLVLHNFNDDRHGFGLVMRLRRNHWLVYVPLLTIGATIVIHSLK